MLIGEVAQPVPLRRTFDYQIPDALRGAAKPGVRVRAAFGPRRLTGMLVSVREGQPQRALKSIDAVVDAEPLLTDELLDLAAWLSRRYCAPLGDCVKSLLPAFVKAEKAGTDLLQRGLVQNADTMSKMSLPSYGACGQYAAGRSRAGEEGSTRSLFQPADEPGTFELTSGQAEAVGSLGERLRARTFGTALLYGVPASGKTEVYLRLMREAIQGGGQALYLLPEISLTRPFFDELNRRAGFSVALWHSRLGVRERRSVWLGLRSGAVQAVVGARSACLLPFKDLRLAIIDEEQDESFKQEGQPPLYHARDVVAERARRTGALLMLGSATPSMEAVARVDSGEWTLHAMPDRVSRTQRPRIEIIAKPPSAGGCLTPELVEAIKDRLAKREQVILLVNRRGFSNFVICRKCGWVARCKSCGVAFIHHQRAPGGDTCGISAAGTTGEELLLARGMRPAPRRAQGATPLARCLPPIRDRRERSYSSPLTVIVPPGTAREDALPCSRPAAEEETAYLLRCHHCGRRADVPKACVACKAAVLTFAGVGTQKVVTELKGLLSGARVLRMDRDTVSKERTHDLRIYDKFKAREADILVGTKLVAKGFHFPDVTLVGVVDADTMLQMPDFRAAERTVQLLVQAAGRSGRAEKPGEVLIQTAQPENYAIQSVARGDYLRYARQELSFRRELGYPPHSTLIRLVFSGRTEEATRDAADKFSDRLRERFAAWPADLLGPSPAVHRRLRGRWRYHLLIKLHDAGRLEECLDAATGIQLPSVVKLQINVDPYDLF